MYLLLQCQRMSAMENLWSGYCQETMSSLPSWPAFCRNTCVIIVGWDRYGNLAPASFYKNKYSPAGYCSVLPTLGVREVQDMGRADWRRYSGKTQRTQGWGCIFLPCSFWRKQRQSTLLVIQITSVTVEEIWIKGHSPLVVGYVFLLCEREDMACENHPELVLYCTSREANSQVMDPQKNMKYICYWHMSITIPFLVLWLIQDLTKNEIFLLSCPKPVINLF